MKKQDLINKVLHIILAVSVVFAARLLDVNGPLLAILLIALFIYLKTQERLRVYKKYNVLSLGLLFVIFMGAADFIAAQNLPAFFIPFSVIPMLTAMLLGELELSLLLTVASSAFLSFKLHGQQPFPAVMMLISGVTSSVLVLQVRRRSQIIRAGLIVGAVQMACLMFIEFFRMDLVKYYLVFLANGILCSVVVAGLLPVFEYMFGIVTNISLLELSDFNHPILRSMILKAPGTYHHSLVVGNLSEAAAEAIGANALLARIGSYYHDIGKIQKAEYFSENQMPLASKHDELAPSMSKLVITNHVKDGIELARKYRLNDKIMDFITEHHGTSLVYYFYRRALESSQDAPEEEGFRYPGPKPRSKETAIVLLADSVEAASRTLKDPSPTRIEELVHKIINNKFIDMQLDECDLTLRDLENIAEVFIRILSGIYHTRTTYPEKESEPR